MSLQTTVKSTALGFRHDSQRDPMGSKLLFALDKSNIEHILDEDREIYEGPFDEHGLRGGFGSLQKANTTYEGYFKRGEKHGAGVLCWVDGRRYSGQFLQSRFHGRAIMSWPDGRHYIGEYRDNRKYGHGIFTWTDGRKYQGQWQHGKRHGRGWYTNAKKETRLGIWHQDKPISWCKPEDADDSEALLTATMAEVEAVHVDFLDRLKRTRTRKDSEDGSSTEGTEIVPIMVRQSTIANEGNSPLELQRDSMMHEPM